MIRHLDKNPEALFKGFSADRLKRAVIGRIDIDYMSGKKPKK